MKINEYYDVFISFKDSDENGNDTKDKAIANELYEYLTSKKLKVFFSAKTFLECGTDEWNNELKEAMNISKVFIVVGTKKEYIQSEYLIWERTFFSALRSRDDSRVLYSYIVSPLTLNDLPYELSILTSFTPQTKEHLYNYIRNHLARVKNGEFKEKINKNNFFVFISSIIVPFFVIFITLSILSSLIYSRLEFEDTIYAFSVVSFILAKIFLFLKNLKGYK